MIPNKTSLLQFLFLALNGLFAITSLTGCGGQSSEDVRTLGILIDEFNASNEEGSRLLANGKAKLGYPFILASYEKQLDILKTHRANRAYKGEIKGHLDALEEGLTEGVKIYQNWVDEGYHAGNPPPEEYNIINSFAIKLTTAETALTIAAGK